MLSDTETKIRDGIYIGLVEVFRTCIIRYDLGNKTPVLLINKTIWIDIFFLLLHNAHLNSFIENPDMKSKVLEDLRDDICKYFNTTDYETVNRFTDFFDDKLDLFVNLLQRRKELIAMIAKRNWLLDTSTSTKSDLENWVAAEKEVEQYLHLKLDDKDEMLRLQTELKSYSNITIIFINQECVVFDSDANSFPDILFRKTFNFR